MLGLAVSILIVNEHRALQARAFVVEAPWMWETCMLPVGSELSRPQRPESHLHR
jgi:hypothetical protein